MTPSHVGKRPASRSPESGMPVRKASRPSALDNHRPSPRSGAHNTVQSPSSVNSRGSGYQDASSTRATPQPQTPARPADQTEMEAATTTGEDPVAGLMSLLSTLSSHAAQLTKLDTARDTITASRRETDRQLRKLAKQNPALAAEYERTRKAQNEKLRQIEDQTEHIKILEKGAIATARPHIRLLIEVSPEEETSKSTDAMSRDFVTREEADQLKAENAELKTWMQQIQESVTALRRVPRLDSRVDQLETESKSYQNGMQQLRDYRASHDELRQQKNAHESDLQAQDSRLTTIDGQIKSLELRLPRVEDKVDGVSRTLDNEVLEEGKPSVIQRMKRYDVMLNNIDPYVKRLRNEKGCALKRVESLEQSRTQLRSTVEDIKEQLAKKETSAVPNLDGRVQILETNVREAADNAIRDGQIVKSKLEEQTKNIKQLLDRTVSTQASSSGPGQLSMDRELGANLASLETRVSNHDQRFEDIEEEGSQRDDLVTKSIEAEIAALTSKLEAMKQELLDMVMETNGYASVLELRVKALEDEPHTHVPPADPANKINSGLQQFKPMPSVSPAPTVSGLGSPRVNGVGNGHLNQEVLNELAAYHAMVLSVKQRMDNMTSDPVVDKMVARMMDLYPPPGSDIAATIRDLQAKDQQITVQVGDLSGRMEALSSQYTAATRIANAAKELAESALKIKDLTAVLTRVDGTDKSVADLTKKVEGCITYTTKANDLNESLAKQAVEKSRRNHEDLEELEKKVVFTQTAAIDAQARTELLTKKYHKTADGLTDVQTKVTELMKG